MGDEKRKEGGGGERGAGVGRDEGATGHSIHESRPDVAGEFSERSDIALDGEEETGSFWGPELAGDLT